MESLSWYTWSVGRYLPIVCIGILRELQMEVHLVRILTACNLVPYCLRQVRETRCKSLVPGYPRDLVQCQLLSRPELILTYFYNRRAGHGF
jgi:hypothetical protein